MWNSAKAKLHSRGHSYCPPADKAANTESPTDDASSAGDSVGWGGDLQLATASEKADVENAEAKGTSRCFYIKRAGYNDIIFYEGSSYKRRGPAAYYADVAAQLVGWDIVLRRGHKQGEPILHLRKPVRFLSLLGWDKGSRMKIWAAQGEYDGSDGVSETTSCMPESTASTSTTTSRMTAISTKAKSAVARHCKDMFGIDKEERLTNKGEESEPSRPASSRRSLSCFSFRDSSMAASAPGQLEAAPAASSEGSDSSPSSALSVLPEETDSAPEQLQTAHSCAGNQDAAALDAALSSHAQSAMPEMPAMPQMPPMPRCTYGCSTCESHPSSADSVAVSEPPTTDSATDTQGLTKDTLQKFNEQQAGTPAPDIKEAVPSLQSGSELTKTSTGGKPAPPALEAGTPPSSMDDSAMEVPPSEQGKELTQSEKGKQQLNKLVQRFASNNDAEPPLVVLKRKHQFRSNRNVFTFNGRKYRWNYFLLLGATLTLKDVATNEVLAIAKLKPAVQTQSITAWGLRQNGCLEIINGAAEEPGLQDMIVATLIGMLEWRKHNNKVWIILAAAMPA